MSDSNDDRRTGSEPDANAPDGPKNRREEASADIDSGTGVGDDVVDRDPRDESTRIVTEDRRRNTPLVSAIVAALGAWAALSVLLFEASQAATWNNLLVGIAVVAAAGYNYYRLHNDIPLSAGVASLVAILGIWLIISAALLEMAGALFWSTLVTGLLVAGLAGYNAYEAREARTVATEPETGT
ncbi:SPW repeat protein [Halopiger thermotolerans]